MKIEFNTVTWYSKLAAEILFLLVFPVLGFYIGTQYELTKFETSKEIEINSVPQVSVDLSPCDAETAQQAMNACTGDESRAIEKRMDTLFAAISEKKKFKGSDVSSLQKQWMAYREAECIARGKQFEGGSMEPMVISVCRSELTNDRIKALEFRLQNFEL
jgi:uncharacterized protein YecT (DUF1311 family)